MLEESPDEAGEWRTWAAGVVLRDTVDRFGGILLVTKKNSFRVGNLLPLKLYVSYTRNNPLGQVLVPLPRALVLVISFCKTCGTWPSLLVYLLHPVLCF